MNRLSLLKFNEWNPQLVRELKGRFQLRNIIVAIGLSILTQLIIFLSTLDKFPSAKDINLGHKYCPSQNQFFNTSQTEYWRIYDKINAAGNTGKYPDLEKQLQELDEIRNAVCPQDLIDFNRWFMDYWANIFIWISVLAIFGLIVLGTYMLINDLATEERRGTLNFIRLSPQSSQSILIGKLLGVPSLLYLGVFLAIPFHLWTGISAQIPPLEIFSFYGLTVASCAFFYSLALLVGVTSSTWLHGLQSWIGSGITLIFLFVANSKPIISEGWDWLNLFSPLCLIRYLIDQTGNHYSNYPFNHANIVQLKWFGLNLGANGISLLALALLNYSFLTYWIWQALKRNYQHPNLPSLSKQQSYLLTLNFTLMNLGFSLSKFEVNNGYYGTIFIGNIFLVLALISALSPQRQTLQDWVRYRVERKKHRWANLAKDLILGEKSPAIVAILINLLIASTIWIVTIFLVVPPSDKSEMLLAVALHCSFMLLCASIAQLMAMMKTPKRTLWATGMVLGVMIIPLLFITVVFSSKPDYYAVFVVSVISFVSISSAPFSAILISFMGQVLISVLCNIQLTRLLKKAGESELKALISS